LLFINHSQTNSRHIFFKVHLVDNIFVGISCKGARLEVPNFGYVFVKSYRNGGHSRYLTPIGSKELTTNFDGGTSFFITRPYIMCWNHFGDKMAIEEHWIFNMFAHPLHFLKPVYLATRLVCNSFNSNQKVITLSCSLDTWTSTQQWRLNWSNPKKLVFAPSASKSNSTLTWLLLHLHRLCFQQEAYGYNQRNILVCSNCNSN